MLLQEEEEDHIFSQLIRLYRCAMVVSILVKNISTKCLTCLNKLVDNHATLLGKEGSH